MNHFKNGNLMIVELLLNVSDTGTVCVFACVCALPLKEYKTSHSKSRL